MDWVSGPWLGLDLETTAANPFEAKPVSWAMALRRYPGRMSIQGGLINPGVPIPAEATEIHGITDQMAQDEGRPLEQAMAEVRSKLLWAEQEGIPVCGMNVSYDLTILDRLVDLSDWHGCVIDIFVLDKAAYKYRKGSRKLNRALIEEYGVEMPEDMSEGHQAAPDAVASLLVLEAMIRRYEWIGKRGLRSLHDSQVHWYRGQQSNLSDHFVEKGKDPIPEYEWAWPIKHRPQEAL